MVTIGDTLSAQPPKRGRGQPARAGKPSDRMFQMRVTDDELVRWREAAAAEGLTLSEYVRRAIASRRRRRS